MKKLQLLLLSLLVICSTFASNEGSDVLTMSNQMVFTGKIKKIKDCSVVFKTEGNKYVIPADDIYSLQFSDTNDKVYTNYLALSAGSENACLNGSLDAENYHGKNGAHFVYGILFGPFAILGTALSNPTPSSGKNTLTMSKNKDQMNDLEYLSCYQKKAKGKLIGMEALGLGATLLLLLLI